MPMGHGPAMADIKEEDLNLKYRNWLHNKDMALQERLSQAENELTSAKKKKKALGNKQKTVSIEFIGCFDDYVALISLLNISNT